MATLIKKAVKTSQKHLLGIQDLSVIDIKDILSEAKKFISLKFHQDAILLRKYDDEGKIPNIKMRKIEDYRNLINSQLI